MKGKVILYAKFNYSQAKVALAQAWAFIAHKINGEREREREREKRREERVPLQRASDQREAEVCQVLQETWHDESRCPGREQGQGSRRSVPPLVGRGCP